LKEPATSRFCSGIPASLKLNALNSWLYQNANCEKLSTV